SYAKLVLRVNPPADNAPPPPEPTNNQAEKSKDRIPRSAGWLRGCRIDDIHRPRILPYQVASYVDGHFPSIEEDDTLFTDVIVTNTKREANYAHHGWSIDAITITCRWISPRVAARNQHNLEGTWYTRITRSKRIRVEVSLEDLAPAPAFQEDIEAALNQTTIFEKFQAIYRTLEHWGDVVPLEIELGSSTALTGDRMNDVQPQELDESSHRLSNTKNALVSITGGNPSWNYDQWAALDDHWERIAVNRVVPTIALLNSDLQARVSEPYAQRLVYAPPNGVGTIAWDYRTYDVNKHASRTISSIKIRSSNHIKVLSITYSDGITSSSHGGGGHVGTEYEFHLAVGEHISEMLIWVQGDWLLGLQFITTMGRCSAQYGCHEGTLTIAR
ncbi:unnamed protein product, partial [Rhizoctonia solani]